MNSIVMERTGLLMFFIGAVGCVIGIIEGLHSVTLWSGVALVLGLFVTDWADRKGNL